MKKTSNKNIGKKKGKKDISYEADRESQFEMEHLFVICLENDHDISKCL